MTSTMPNDTNEERRRRVSTQLNNMNKYTITMPIRLFKEFYSLLDVNKQVL